MDRGPHSQAKVSEDGSDRRAKRRRKNIMLAVALGLVAFGFYLFALLGGGG